VSALRENLGGVVIGVRGVAAGGAPEGRLGVATGRVHVLTDGTRLGGMRGGHSEELAVVPHALVVELSADLGEADAQERAIESRFLRNAGSWRVRRAAGAPRHRRDAKIFDDDDLRLSDDGGRQLMLVVPPSVGDVAQVARESLPAAPRAPTATLAASELSLESGTKRPLVWRFVTHGVVLAVRCCGGVGHAEVDAKEWRLDHARGRQGPFGGGHRRPRLPHGIPHHGQ
jgi:hypothetical protein